MKKPINSTDHYYDWFSILFYILLWGAIGLSLIIAILVVLLVVAIFTLPIRG